MLILRLLLVLGTLIIVSSAGLYWFTREPRYLHFSWQVARFIFFALAVFVVLFVLERYVLTGWRVLV